MLAKSRRAWNKGTRRVRVIGGYDYVKGSRLTGLVMFSAFTLLSFCSMGYGQIAKMKESSIVQAKEYVKPVIVISGQENYTEKQQIMAYIIEKFGNDADDAITILNKCENSEFNQQATNHNRNGSVDYGVFQINSIHEKRYGSDFKTDWKANVDVAYSIFKERGWTAWACSEHVGIKPFWK